MSGPGDGGQPAGRPRLHPVFQETPPLRFAPGSLALAAAIVAIYLGRLSHVEPDSLASLEAAGALYGPWFWDGQPWRVLTAAFVHEDLLHLLANILFLIEVGRWGELRLGTPLYLAILFLSGAAGGITAVLASDYPFLGAECALVGAGAATAVALWHAGLRPDTGPGSRRFVLLGGLYAAYALVSSFLVTRSNPDCVIVSLIVGGALGTALALAAWPEPRRAAAALLLLVVVSAFTFSIGAAVEPRWRPFYLMHRAEQALTLGDTLKAKALTAEAEAEMQRRFDHSALRHQRLVSLWVRLEQPKRAAEALLASLAHQPAEAALLGWLLGLYLHASPELAAEIDGKRVIAAYERGLGRRRKAQVLNNLATLYLDAPQVELRDASRALELAREAVALDVDQAPAILHTQARAEVAAGEAERAVGLMRKALGRAPRDHDFYEAELDRYRSLAQPSASIRQAPATPTP